MEQEESLKQVSEIFKPVLENEKEVSVISIAIDFAYFDDDIEFDKM